MMLILVELDWYDNIFVIKMLKDLIRCAPAHHCIFWWFTWLEQLVKVLSSVSGIRTTRCYASQVSFDTWNYPWRIWHHWMLELKICTDTATLPISWRQIFWNSCRLYMLFCFVIIFEAISFRYNRLIIYLIYARAYLKWRWRVIACVRL